MSDIERLTRTIAEFCDARDWDQFHSPKNLSMALSVEASELVEVFQWMTEQQSRSLSDSQHTQAQDEIADVFYYLLRIADKLDVNLVEALEAKLVKNDARYPVHKVKGSSAKYSDFSGNKESEE